MPGDDIANIWLDSSANVLGCVPRGAPALAPPRNGAGCGARRCTLDARCRLPFECPCRRSAFVSPRDTDRTYLSIYLREREREIHLPLGRPLFADDRLLVHGDAPR